MKTRDELKCIEYLVIDIDGTMTDGGVYYDDNGNELKKFNTKDAAGFFAASYVGIKTVIITGRECPATTRRLQELKADHVFQKVKDKTSFLTDFMKEKAIAREQIGYLGDDLNDLGGMKLCGFIGCPEDACKEVKRIADYKSPVKGGYGAVRDIIEYMLTERGQWEEAYTKIYDCGM